MVLVSWLSDCLILSIVYFHVSALVPSGAIQITTHPEGTVAGQGLQTLTMTNANPSSGASATPGTATIVQYAQGPDGQFLIPGMASFWGKIVFLGMKVFGGELFSISY